MNCVAHCPSVPCAASKPLCRQVQLSLNTRQWCICIGSSAGIQGCDVRPRLYASAGLTPQRRQQPAPSLQLQQPGPGSVMTTPFAATDVQHGSAFSPAALPANPITAAGGGAAGISLQSGMAVSGPWRLQPTVTGKKTRR